MAWEQRGNKFYYYRKVRKGKRVVSEYVGAGDMAKLLYILDASDQEERENERQVWKEKHSEFQTTDVEIAQLNKILRNLVLATLLVSGYHPHKGQWRRNRNV